MNVSLPEAIERFVRQKVAAGDYETVRRGRPEETPPIEAAR